MKIERFDFEERYKGHDLYCAITECLDGDYVRFNDHENEINKRDHLINDLKLKIKELESENIKLSLAIQEHSEGFYICPICSYEMSCKDHAVVNSLSETPTTKETINEIKANYLEWIIKTIEDKCKVLDPIGFYEPAIDIKTLKGELEKLRTNHD